MSRAGSSALVVLAALVGTLLLAGLPANVAHAAEDPSITIPSGSATAEVGNIVVISVLADDLVDLYAYTLEFTFDPALIEFVSATDPPDIDGFGEASVLPDGRTVRYLHTALGSSPTASGSVELVRMRFRLLGIGSTTIDFASAEFVNSTGETTSQSGVGDYAISAVSDTAAAGGPTATAPDAAGDGSAVDRTPGDLAGSDELAGTGVTPLPALLLGVECLLTGGVLASSRKRPAPGGPVRAALRSKRR